MGVNGSYISNLSAGVGFFIFRVSGISTKVETKKMTLHCGVISCFDS